LHASRGELRLESRALGLNPPWGYIPPLGKFQLYVLKLNVYLYDGIQSNDYIYICKLNIYFIIKKYLEVWKPGNEKK
jgi:hypothetical protein